MEIVRGIFGGEPAANPQVSSADTIERLVDRVTTSTLLEDRRDACRALKAMARKFRLEVGAQGLQALITVLETDSSDKEIISYVLEALCYICAPEIWEEEVIPDDRKDVDGIGQSFTEIFLKQEANVGFIILCLESFDFKIRRPSIQLLSYLLTNCPKEVQQQILNSHIGVSRLMDLLGESREILRNDALMLLYKLTKGNSNLQKIVAFENAFDKLMDIIEAEGWSDGGIVVEDCLRLMLNLLRNNTSNQTFFKEGSYIARIGPFLEIIYQQNESDLGWSAQKVSNMLLMLQVIRTLVSPENPSGVTLSCQQACHSGNVMNQLTSILLAVGIPADVLTETINTLAEVIRGNNTLQEHFMSVSAPTTPPRAAVILLLMSMVNEKQPFGLRCSVLYCFQSYLHRNPTGQASVIASLLPTTLQSADITSGQLACGGLFANDFVSNWLSSAALAHALLDSEQLKKDICRVQVSGRDGGEPVSLLAQCVGILQQTPHPVTRLGLLQLICCWVSGCPPAMALLLSTPGLVAFLLTQILQSEHEESERLGRGLCAFLLGLAILENDGSVEGYTGQDIKALVEKRIGVEVFVDKIADIQRSEAFNKAVKHPQIQCGNMTELMLDHRFCELFRSLDREVTGVVAKKQLANGNGGEGGGEIESEASSIALEQYKQFIREQDVRMKEFVEANANLNQELMHTRTQLGEMTAEIELVRDHNSILQAQAINSATATPQEASTTPATDTRKVSKLEHVVGQLHTQLTQQGEYILELEARLGGLCLQQNVTEETSDNGSQATIETSCQGSQSQIEPNSGPSAWTDLKNSGSQTDAQVVQAEQNSPSDEEMKSKIMIEKLKKQMESMHAVLNSKNNELIELKNDLPLKGINKPVDRFENMFMTSMEVEANSKKIEKMEADLKSQELVELNDESKKELEALREEREELRKDLLEARNRIQQLEKNNEEKNLENLREVSLENQLREAGLKLEELQSLRDEKVVYLQDKSNEVTIQLSEANEQIETLQSEQEDLLVMLSDQETKIQEYRGKLNELGIEDVEESEDLT